MNNKGITFLNDLASIHCPASEKIDPLGEFMEFVVTDEELSEISSPNWVYPGLVSQGQLTVIVAVPNGGKTTIMHALSGEMVEKGFRVLYVNADISAVDAKDFITRSKQMGVEPLTPDLKIGGSMDAVVEKLRKLVSQPIDLSKVVFIFDTLKKMGNLINKASTKDLFKLLRQLTSRGATVVCLGHANKYPDQDGKPVYEGTGDVRSDCDNLIYFIPDKHADGSMTVSVVPDKTRAALECMTFSISPDRKVTRTDEYVDVIKDKEKREQRQKDEHVIEIITGGMQGGSSKQSDLIECCRNHGISDRKSRDCLKRYSRMDNQIWQYEKGAQYNAYYYRLI